MNGSTRVSGARRVALCATLVALFASAVSGVASAALVAYADESYQEFEHQLAAGEIQSVTVNKRLASLRITLKDGRYVLAHYKRHGEPAAVAALTAKKVPVTVLTPTEALKQIPKKPVHHKLRYIAGGIGIVVIAIVVAVLMLSRRRRAAADY
jgi:ATP-dependent Zn protease